MRQGRIAGIHGYAVSALLMAAASGDLVRSAIDAPPRPAKPPRAQKHCGPVIDTTRETKREKRRRLKAGV